MQNPKFSPSTPLSNLETFLLQLTVFLIPANLALHWYSDAAYLNGHLVDYLLPRLYLSDIPILCLVVIFLFKSFRFKLNRAIFSVFILMAYVITRSFFTSFPLGSIWVSLKVLECMLLFAYLVAYPVGRLLRLTLPPFLMALIFQSILALYQFIHHSSLFGYLFFGEPNLSSAGIATTAWFGVLEVAPYGTTPHPNVLAGFLVIGLLFYWLGTHISLRKSLTPAVNIVVIGLVTSIIILTQSLSALAALVLIFLAIFVSPKISTLRYHLILQICGIISLIVVPLFISFVYQSDFLRDNPSFTIRYELNRVAVKLIQSSPLLGVGPNQFILHLPQTTLTGQTTLFLQPPHNLLLLILSETGFLGFFLLVLSLYLLWQTYPGAASPNLYFLPLLALLFIGSLDHYPLTLQTGQLLLTFASAVALAGQKDIS